MISEVVNGSVCLSDIDITSFQIRLSRKYTFNIRITFLEKFYDGPKQIARQHYNYNREIRNNEDTTELPTYTLSKFEAGKYKEWVVWKFTTKGKKRKRIFVIDCDEIYLLHSTTSFQACRSASQLFIFISDIVDVQIDEKQTGLFSLQYIDRDEDSEEDSMELNHSPGR